MSDALTAIRAAREATRLADENARLRRALLEAVMTMNRSDPFFTVFTERYGDLLPMRGEWSDDAA